MSENLYRVRVGDDGRIYSRHEDRAEAVKAAIELAKTGWSGNAQVLDDGGKLVQIREGGEKIVWLRS